MGIAAIMSGAGSGINDARMARVAEETALRDHQIKLAQLRATVDDNTQKARAAAIKDEKDRLTNTVNDLAARSSEAFELLAKSADGEMLADPANVISRGRETISRLVALKNQELGPGALSDDEFQQLFLGKVKKYVATPEQAGAAAGRQAGGAAVGEAQTKVTVGAGNPALARALNVQTPSQKGADEGAQAVATAQTKVGAGAQDPNLARALNVQTPEQKAGDVVTQAQTVAGAAGPEVDTTAALRGMGVLPAKQLVNLQSPDGKGGIMTLDENDPLVEKLTARGWTKAAEGGQTINVNTAPPYSILDQEAAKRLAERDATRLKTEVDDPAQSARQTKIDIAQMRSASGGFETGAFGEFRASVSRIAKLFGLDPEEIGFGLGNPVSADMISTAQNRMVIEVQTRMKGATSDRDINFAKNSVPGLLLTPDGNVLLMEVMDRVADRSMQRQMFFENFLDQHDGALRPGKGEKSAWVQWAEYEQANPIIDDDLQKRVEAASSRSSGIVSSGKFNVPETWPGARSEEWRKVDKGKLVMETWDRNTGVITLRDQTGGKWSFRAN